MSVFDHDGIQFYYERTGKGPPVVICHGLTGDCGVIKLLLNDFDGHDLVIWDCRGHGRTEPVGRHDAYNLSTFADDLHALLEHLRIERAIVGGVSMGAAIATRFALDWPTTVEALVLIRPAWLDRPAPEPLRLLIQVGELLGTMESSEGQQRLAGLPLFHEMQKIDPQAAAAALELFNDPRAVERRVRLARIPRDCPISGWTEIERLTMPALVIGCEPDYVHPLSYAQEWAQRLPRAEFLQVPAKSVDETKYTAAVRAAVKSFIAPVWRLA